MMTIRCFLGLGANLDAPVEHITQAISAIAALPHTRVIQQAPLYGSAPLAGMDQPDYCNTVVEIHTLLAPFELLHTLQALENDAGRQRDTARWSARPLDIDILSYGTLQLQTTALTVPHSAAAERSFVVRPWADLDPHFTLAAARKTVGELAKTTLEPAIWPL